jgi:hypothetical protein
MTITERLHRLLTVLAVALASLVAIYSAAYGMLGRRSEAVDVAISGEARIYSERWLARLFDPAAKVESMIRQKNVRTSWSSPPVPGPVN